MKSRLSFILALSISIAGCTKKAQELPADQPIDNAQQAIGLKGQNHLLPGVDQYRLLVKFKAAAIEDVEKNQPVFAARQAPAAAATWGRTSGDVQSYTYEQAIPLSPEEKTALKQGRQAAPAPGQFNRYAFRGLLYVKEAPGLSPAAVLKLANAFEQLDIVEYAAIEPVNTPPPPTPDFTSQQYYKNDVDASNPSIRGINANYAWSIGVTGSGIRIADIEWGYNKNHEDLTGGRNVEVLPPPDDQFKDHGTAVTSILVAKNNGFGVTGLVYGADSLYVISERVAGRPAGIAAGLQRLRRGDVFLYEMQTGGQGGQYVPADYNQAVWDITKTATDSGIVIVAAAGNGNQDLDGAFYAGYRARGDNGAIIVGAGTKSAQNKASFSTYGSSVHIQGWGDWSVTSAGYGTLYNGGPNATYSNNFSGTSSATPIAASAVIAVQSWYKARTGTVLSPRAIRNLLINTGTPQGTGGHIGPLPNIKSAIESLLATGLSATAKRY
ncbi:S8 family serine peptidase [Chitinophaga sp. G-6-1-13]|uniref:S8 family serine peptidase n=1 Tax=Chitinophaga fulva TaxID=2728842 RepID=A0A848GQ61_9BACT|nr:S8 family serine peptidase [Chitinophaga fulva]NML40666.1 S8 family serine peptidase [Chitinophaga fulva]